MHQDKRLASILQRDLPQSVPQRMGNTEMIPQSMFLDDFENPIGAYTIHIGMRMQVSLIQIHVHMIDTTIEAARDTA